MTKNFLPLFLLLSCGLSAIGQQPRFVKSGKIEFERTVNMFGILRKSFNPKTDQLKAQIYEQYRNTQPQFIKYKSTLVFNQDRALFSYDDNQNLTNAWAGGNPLASPVNKVFTNLETHFSITEKNVLGSFFSVQDSIKKIKWKLTNEVREIAGFQCRRANGMISDSVYVVAFYTGKIPVPAGPEAFNGLPGMILGIALPHDDVTWFATKVIDVNVPLNDIIPSKKGKKVTSRELMNILNESIRAKSFSGLSPISAFAL